MKIYSISLIIGIISFVVGCDPSYRIRRDNNLLDDSVSFDCIKTAIEKVPGVKLISDETSNEPISSKSGRSARQIKYLSEGESILVTGCYDGSKLQSFSQYQSGLA
jgi:hypothetical protein